MSICFTRFPIVVVIGEPYIYQNLGDFTRIDDFTWRVSDCEELLGGYSKDDGVCLRGGCYGFIHFPFIPLQTTSSPNFLSWQF